MRAPATTKRPPGSPSGPDKGPRRAGGKGQNDISNEKRQNNKSKSIVAPINKNSKKISKECYKWRLRGFTG